MLNYVIIFRGINTMFTKENFIKLNFKKKDINIFSINFFNFNDFVNGIYL